MAKGRRVSVRGTALAVAVVALATACSSSAARGTKTTAAAATRTTAPATVIKTTQALTDWVERPPSQAQTGGGKVSVFPSPGTPTASPKSEISIRGIAPSQIGPVRVVGSKSGRHAGRLLAHADGQGASFVLAKPFTPGERVRVTTKLKVRGGNGGSYSFTVARPAPEPPPDPNAPKPKPPSGKIVRFASRPDIVMTGVQIRVNEAGQAPGLVFVAMRRGKGTDGVELLDSRGKLVWFKPTPKGTTASDFREQVLDGRPVLTYWQGGSPAVGHGNGRGIILDDTYKQIGTVHAGNGYAADLHEFELTSAGTAFVTAYRVVNWDLSSVGGPRNGLALDCIAQEVEIGTGRVLFEWHSLGHVPLSDGYARAPKDRSATYDYFHINSITSDDQGNLLVSGRGTHTVYDIDPRTGAVHWRLGGKRSTIKLGPGVSFHSQHNAKWDGPETMSIFDNGAGVGGNNHTESRGIVLHVDEAARRATLIRQLKQPLGKLFSSQGNVEQLPNGNWFVGWGEGPYATEFKPNGKVVWAIHYDSGSSYRAYRFPWVGHPATKPSIVVTRKHGKTRVSASWNGATEVARWQLLAGPSADSLAPVTTAPKFGFETTMTARAGAAFVAMRALDSAGATLGTSPTVRTHH